MGQSKILTTLEVTGCSSPPDWAVKQRYLIDLMNHAAVDFLDRYTRPDGTLIWRDAWPGLDGSDDGYESFVTFPLFYILGGGEHVHALARSEWNAVTWQFTGYGQVHREYDAYYDWMHHGESSTYIYYLGLADLYHPVDRTRTLRFAAMYIGGDADTPNWDPVHKMLCSPINGSRGPPFEMSAEVWVTYRPVLADYLSPYEGVPGFDFTGDASWLDLHRSQADLLWSLRREEDGVLKVPFRHSDGGWLDYRPMQSRHFTHLYFMSRDPAEWARLEERFPDRAGWYSASPRFGKTGHFWPEK